MELSMSCSIDVCVVTVQLPPDGGLSESVLPVCEAWLGSSAKHQAVLDIIEGRTEAYKSVLDCLYGEVIPGGYELIEAYYQQVGDMLMFEKTPSEIAVYDAIIYWGLLYMYQKRKGWTDAMWEQFAANHWDWTHDHRFQAKLYEVAKRSFEMSAKRWHHMLEGGAGPFLLTTESLIGG